MEQLNGGFQGHYNEVRHLGPDSIPPIRFLCGHTCLNEILFYHVQIPEKSVNVYALVMHHHVPLENESLKNREEGPTYLLYSQLFSDSSRIK